MNDVDLLEEHLQTAFEDARTDPRWSGSTWSDPAGRVRHRAKVVHRRAASATAMGAVVAVAGAAVALPHLRSEDRVSVQPRGGDYPSTGLSWLLTPSQYGDYSAAHPSPSAAPDHVASPAPSDAELTQLDADVSAALGAPQVIRRDAADGGDAGHAIIWALTGDAGTPVAVERYRLGYPLQVGDEVVPAPTAGSDASASEQFTDPQQWADGTAYTVATGDAFGYAFGPGQQWSGPVVWTVTPDGWFTSWTAPVSVDRLLGWARAADDSFTGAGGGAG